MNKTLKNADFYAAVSAITRYIEQADSASPHGAAEQEVQMKIQTEYPTDVQTKNQTNRLNPTYLKKGR